MTFWARILATALCLNVTIFGVCQTRTAAKPGSSNKPVNASAKASGTKLIIRAAGPCTVTLDGDVVKRFDSAGILSVAVIPGEHAVEASNADAAPFSQIVDVTKGTSKVVTIQLTSANSKSKDDAASLLQKQMAQAQQEEQERRRQAES